ncbi:hypothetical protein [Ruegeria sp. A3M17]
MSTTNQNGNVTSYSHDGMGNFEGPPCLMVPALQTRWIRLWA